MDEFKKFKMQDFFASCLGWVTYSKSCVRILAYHSISDKSPTFNNVPPSLFRQHLKWLKENGFCFLRVKDLAVKWGNIFSKGRAVIITFDDGLLNNYLIAAPILYELSIPATFFIPTAYIQDAPYVCQANEMGKYELAEMMCWDNLKELAQLGFEIGSHSHWHFSLGRLSDSEIKENINLSKKTLECHLFTNIDSFAYPKGKESSFNSYTQKCLQEAGFKFACTTIEKKIQPATSFFELPRIGITGFDDLKTFRKKVEGFYDILPYLRILRQIT